MVAPDVEKPICWNTKCPENCIYEIESHRPKTCPYKQDEILWWTLKQMIRANMGL